jgi:Xaa-Pro aminopeptidase
MLADRIPAIQAALAEADLDGWFFLCFQQNDPVSVALLGLADRFISRRCYYFVPREGEPRRLAHGIEPAMLDALPGSKRLYTTWAENRAEVRNLVAGARRVAAQVSHDCALPAVSRLDVGTADLLRSLGIELVSSADLIQRFAATWTDAQLAGHRRACTHLHAIAHAAFAEVSSALRQGRTLDEYAVQQWILAAFEQAGLHAETTPIIGVNGHSADPHYMPSAVGSSPIRPGDFLLIDLWAKEKATDSVYADISWCGVCAPTPTARQAEVFAAAAAGRDAGVDLLRRRWPHTPVAGWEVDDAVRQVITAAGWGQYFIHRTGHSIHTMDHGPGANIDNFETHDDRRLIAMTGFSIEPGIYLADDFGVRTEINIALTPAAVEVTGGEPQHELLRLLA